MKARTVKKLDPAAPLADNAARIVRVRIDELRSFAPKALEPQRSDDQHDMRIAAKRLRYVLEATELCFGKPAATARRRARDLQDLLGELHDCDVMLPRVQRHIEELRERDATAIRGRAGEAEDLEPALAARAPSRTAYRGLEILSVYLEARRRLLFDRFAEYWEEQERKETWTALDREAARLQREAKERRKAAERAAEAERELAAAEQAEREAADRARRAAEELAQAEREARAGTVNSGS